jgi:hypothetical protein
MSSGGIAQLVAIGAQDTFITGKPEVSFFQSVYKHHTNFSQVVSRQVIQGNPSAGGMSSVRFERSGDLMGYVYISPICTVNGLPTTYETVNWSNVINYVEFYIGGQLIDRIDSTFTEFLAPNLMSQNVSKSWHSKNHAGYGTSSSFYPLRFWFCENAQSALPLVALQYHDVEVRIYWSPNLKSQVASSVGAITDPAPPSSIVNYELYLQNIYLDNDERKYISEKPHDILITQVQSMNPTGSKNMPIVFNHPVKYICATNSLDVSNTVTSNAFALTSSQNQVLIQINGSDIGDYRYACPHFTQVPTYYCTQNASGNAGGFFLFSFCLDTSKLQPTGSLNFSRLDSFRIVSQNLNIYNTVYGVNYNILRIQGGMAGLMYSN